MVKLLEHLPELFRQRYLDTHEKFLKSIADIAAHLYFKTYNHLEDGCEIMIKILLSAGNFSEKMTNESYESPYFRNLRNSWFHEVALNNPEGDLNERLKFAPWKIIQCYYSIFAGISALIRCFNSSTISSHKKIFNIFGNEFLRNKKRKIYFLPPYNFYLNQQGNFDPLFEKIVNWNYASEYHIPKIKQCLKSVHTKNHLTTIPHYLKKLREWAQYEDSYLFFRLYGESVKKNLDFSLKRISFGYLVQIEFFLIKFFGWKSLKLQFDTFNRELEQNLEIKPTNLSQRFIIYEKYLSK
ncbi:MAG: hypothetical protein ACFFD2_18445 [Promethearchaeota archaeon]